MESINALSWKNLKNFNIKNILIFWKEIKGPFLFPLVGGIIISILFFSRYIEFLLIEETIGIWSFFFGLLISSIIFLIQRELKFNFSSLLCLSLGAITSAWVTSSFNKNINKHLIV